MKFCIWKVLKKRKFHLLKGWCVSSAFQAWTLVYRLWSLPSLTNANRKKYSENCKQVAIGITPVPAHFSMVLPLNRRHRKGSLRPRFNMLRLYAVLGFWLYLSPQVSGKSVREPSQLNTSFTAIFRVCDGKSECADRSDEDSYASNRLAMKENDVPLSVLNGTFADLLSVTAVGEYSKLRFIENATSF